MDFSFTDDQLTIRDLARGIFEKELTPERIRACETGPEAMDRPLWSTLAEAGLLGLVAPADLGGMGFGIAEACVFLQEVGRAVAPIPALPAIVLGALPIAAFGTPAQRQRWLAPLASGSTILTGGLVDAGASGRGALGTTAVCDGAGWRLTGEKRFVPAAHLAERIVVCATAAAGVGTFLVDPHAEGVTLVRHEMSNRQPLFTVKLSDAPVDPSGLLGGDDGTVDPRWLYERAVVATCATHVGVAERVLELTSRYVSEREQFGVPIGSFQAVQHRLADAYIDLEAMRWVTWRATWMLSGRATASREVAVAKFWTAEGGSRIADAAQHLHGGIGADIDYPIARYFLWSKALELSLGAATPHLAELGQELARTGPLEAS
jgi:alkylation response protein AidB-like acyl-CoA dehydrogenase